mgnify:FL=1
MSVNEILKDADHRMDQSIEAMKHDFQSIRTGRANPLVLERVKVDYYGVECPINQVANVTVPEPRQLMVTPFERNMLGPIEKAIQKSDLGINPLNDGQCLRLNFPQMTEDRRKEMVRQVNSRAEQACVAIRNVRRDAIAHLKALDKSKELSEDELKRHEHKGQEMTDKHIANVHELQKRKDEELMEV